MSQQERTSQQSMKRYDLLLKHAEAIQDQKVAVKR